MAILMVLGLFFAGLLVELSLLSRIAKQGVQLVGGSQAQFLAEAGVAAALMQNVAPGAVAEGTLDTGSYRAEVTWRDGAVEIRSVGIARGGRRTVTVRLPPGGGAVPENVP